ncbi:MAG: hypothetical protein FVQ80_13820 [Planctomycetes bacterium]|nr:hypothetical protein [Planctomycetota bacterium]
MKEITLQIPDSDYDIIFEVMRIYPKMNFNEVIYDAIASFTEMWVDLTLDEKSNMGFRKMEGAANETA